jgi:hypothetical protein
MFLSSKLGDHPFYILDKLIICKCNSMWQNQGDLALKVLGQQLVAESLRPAAVTSPNSSGTDAVGAAERSSGERACTGP